MRATTRRATARGPRRGGRRAPPLVPAPSPRCALPGSPLCPNPCSSPIQSALADSTPTGTDIRQEDVTDIQLAWENLEMARQIYSAHPGNGVELGQVPTPTQLDPPCPLGASYPPARGRRLGTHPAEDKSLPS